MLEYCTFDHFAPDGDEHYFVNFPFVENEYYYDILLGFGNKCECIEPLHIRKEMKRRIYWNSSTHKNTSGCFSIQADTVQLDKTVFSTADLSAILMGLSSLSSVVRGDELVNALAKVKSFIPAEKVKVSKEPVKTMGGLTIVPDCSISDIEAGEKSVLLLPGANTWSDPKHSAIIEKAGELLSAGAMVMAALTPLDWQKNLSLLCISPFIKQTLVSTTKSA